MTTLGIAIPAYDAKGRGPLLLEQCLASIARQDTGPDSLVVSLDEGSSPDLLEVAESAGRCLPQVRVVRNQALAGIGANSNSALGHLSTDVAWVLHQDDFLVDQGHIGRLRSVVERSPAGWWVMRSHHVDLDRQGLRSENQTHDIHGLPNPSRSALAAKLSLGLNPLGAPSVIAFRRRNDLRFRADLSLLVDVEFYRRCQRLYGLPEFTNLVVGIGEWSGQTQRGLSRATHFREIVKWRAQRLRTQFHR